ncbi:MAG: MMPL family transporter [Leptospiraceae bacterium]|nr:MMPL family transporter [Leptospiraceae bacterium]MCP5512609.1 MMPL family transporter [Leptospiraceae bacterium]
MKKFVSKLSEIILNRPLVSIFILLIFVVLSTFQIGNISINSNQIDLLPPEYPEVQKTKDVIEMIGGNGFFIIALKYKDEKGREEHIKEAFIQKNKGNLEKFKEEMELAEKIRSENPEYYKSLETKLKKTSDRVYKHLEKDKDIRYISYRYDVSFLQDRFPLFILPDDLREVRNRVNKQLEREKNKLNPFFMNLGGDEEEINFDDIIQKYAKLSKRDIFDEYTISQDKGMLIMLVKPNGSFIDIEFTRAFSAKIRSEMEKLELEKEGISFGFTGTYQLNLDDYDSLVHALKPISIASLIGIIILLLLFFRKPIFIIILTNSLLVGVIITFGITGKFIGRLNTITSVLSAVLMGLGIDYGIQFLYRFREEFTLRDDFLSSVKETIYHTGMASFTSALTTTSAFVILMFSEFRGFSEFGLIACYGILMIALSMYFVTALQISLFLKYFPEKKKVFYFEESQKLELAFVHKIFDNPAKVLLLSGAFILFFSSFSPLLEFNYSGRDLLLENQESLLLYDEIADRFDVSSDPQVILVDTFEETERIADFFTPMPEHMGVILDQVVSDWNLVPSVEQQRENLNTLRLMRKDLEELSPEMVPDEYKHHLPTMEKYLNVKEFTYEEIPMLFKRSFREIPGSKKKGFMLFVYPKIALWHGKDLMLFYEKAGNFKYPIVSWRTINILLNSEKIDYNREHGKYRVGEFSEEEEKIILEKSNGLSYEDMLDLGILPGTAEFIIKNRRYSSLSDLRKFKGEASTVGSVILFAKLAQIVQSEGYYAIFATIFVVTIILIVLYRSFIASIASLIPLLLGILVMLGIMGMSNLKINFMNILVFPIIIGYAIQNGIYIYYRFQEEKDIATTLVKVGPAITASTLTTLVGWAVLLLAEHRGLHSIGVAASIGIASSLVVALTLLPSILGRFFSPQKPHSSTNLGLNYDISDSNPEIEIQPPPPVLDETKVEPLEFVETDSLPEKPVKKKTTTPKVSKKKVAGTTTKKKSKAPTKKKKA